MVIYDTKSTYFQSFLTANRHTPTTDEIVDALNDIKRKTPHLKLPEERAAALSDKYPLWLLDDVNWVDLSAKLDAQDDAADAT